MPNKLVFAKELKSETTSTGKAYKSIIDQDVEKWPLWDPVEIQVGKAYLIEFHTNEKGFKDIDRITPVINIFQEKALRDVANKSDYKRDLFMSLSYAKDLMVAGKVSPADNVGLFSMAWQMYEWVNQTADKLMPKENGNVEPPKAN